MPLDPNYPRDLIGYGAAPPDPQWPDGARLAMQFVINYEEGAENTILHGDAASEPFLFEIVGARALQGKRHLAIESLFEYGSRVGVWRLFRLFQERQIPITMFANAMALERNSAVAEAAMAAGFEICGHGYRWIDYLDVPEEVEREHLHKSIEIQTRLAGERPLGWYTGRTSDNTRRLVAEEGGFLYDADAYNDELPYWTDVAGKPYLIVPYTLDANDMRFAMRQGFNSGDQFYSYLKDSFDTLYDEGASNPKMLSVGLHCRIAGRPGRFAALKRFVDYAQSHDGVWFCRRVDIARHWRATFPAPADL